MVADVPNAPIAHRTRHMTRLIEFSANRLQDCACFVPLSHEADSGINRHTQPFLHRAENWRRVRRFHRGAFGRSQLRNPNPIHTLTGFRDPSIVRQPGCKPRIPWRSRLRLWVLMDFSPFSVRIVPLVTGRTTSHFHFCHRGLMNPFW